MTATPNISELARKAVEADAKAGKQWTTTSDIEAIEAFKDAATPERWLALTARIDELEKGLKPFADAAKPFINNGHHHWLPSDQHPAIHEATIGDLRTAARLLHPTSRETRKPPAINRGL